MTWCRTASLFIGDDRTADIIDPKSPISPDILRTHGKSESLACHREVFSHRLGRESRSDVPVVS